MLVLAGYSNNAQAQLLRSSVTITVEAPVGDVYVELNLLLEDMQGNQTTLFGPITTVSSGTTQAITCNIPRGYTVIDTKVVAKPINFPYSTEINRFANDTYSYPPPYCIFTSLCYNSYSFSIFEGVILGI